MIRLRSALVAILATMVGLLEPAAAETRVALVVANSRYTSVPSLSNPQSDALLIAAALRRAGFKTVDVRENLGKVALDSALRDFAVKADAADVALVYFAGHGIEAGGQNYLVPVDARLLRDRDLEVEAVPLATVLRMTEGARGLRMVVLDACRDNPFLVSMVRSNAGRSVGRGLARVEPPRDTAVMYAAKDGAIAADGRAGTNSPFAAALSRRLTQPGLEISLLFRVVRDDVLRATGGGQEPYTYSSLSGEAFYFVPEGTAAQAIAPAVAPKLVPPPRVASPLPTPAFVKPSTSTKASAGQGMVALGSYCSFMRSQPDSAGQNQLVLLPEGEAWAATTANGGFMCYQSFARVYPTGARAAAARDAMRGLVPKLGGDRPAELQNARSLVTDRDYPERALRMEKQGDVTVLLSFDEFGLPSACQIASSSGYEDLDEHTCRVVRRRARVTPAIKGGSLQSSQFRIPIRWTLSN